MSGGGVVDAARAGGEVAFELDFASGDLKAVLSMHEAVELGGVTAKAETSRKQQVSEHTWNV